MTFEPENREKYIEKVATHLSLSRATAEEWFKRVSQLNSSVVNARLPELLDTFPDAGPIAKRTAKAKIKELRADISSLSDLRDLWMNDINKMHFSLQPSYIAYVDEMIGNLLEGYEKNIKKYQHQLNYIEGLKYPERKPRGDIVTPPMIERAKAYDCRDLIDTKRGTTLCLFHDDHTPSMKVYADHVYCFSCQRHEDSIGVFMALNGVDFRTAVRALAT